MIEAVKERFELLLQPAVQMYLACLHRTAAAIAFRRLDEGTFVCRDTAAKKLCPACHGPPSPPPYLVALQHAVSGETWNDKSQRPKPVPRDSLGGVLDAQQLPFRAQHARNACQLTLLRLLIIVIVNIRLDQQLQQLLPVHPKLPSKRHQHALLLDSQQITLHLRNHGLQLAVLHGRTDAA